RESLEDQLRMRLTNHCLTFRRHEVVYLLDLVFDVPELTGNAHAPTFMEPIVLIGTSLIRKVPQISASAHEYGGTEHFAGAKIAHAVTAHLQANRHIDHRPLARHGEKAVQARRIIEAVVAAIVDPGSDPTAAKSIDAEIIGHVAAPARLAARATGSSFGYCRGRFD